MTAGLEDPQDVARRTGARILSFPGLARATQADFGLPKSVLFIHGFTANSGYMVTLMHQFAGAGFKALAYEYPSDRGIDVAAQTLCGLLQAYDANGDISREGLSLVCHSMGGLVARALVGLEGGQAFVRKIITLGTPHGGTLRKGAILRLTLSWGEFVSGLNPNAFSTQSRSARQLVEDDPNPTLLARLRGVQGNGSGIAFHSLSGGLNRLAFGRGKFRDLLANAYLQANLPLPNDGLVAETSSDLSTAAFRACTPGATHHASYAEYPFTNHSFLVENQTVAMAAVAAAR